MTGAEIAAAFTQQNDKKNWKARAINTENTEIVYFEGQGGMIALQYNVGENRFSVKFTKFHGAWGDYINAISRALYSVLNTLKSAGLPFEAPPSPHGILIATVAMQDGNVYVAWQPGVDMTVHLNDLVETDTSVNHPPADAEPVNEIDALSRDIRNGEFPPMQHQPKLCEDEGCPHFGTLHVHAEAEPELYPHSHAEPDEDRLPPIL